MKRVLVVEDYPSLQTLYRFALEKAGYKVDICGDGAEALYLTQTNKYDAILLDLLLRRVSGIDFLKEFKTPNIHKNTKVIVISNIKHPDVVRETERLGVSAYYVKSVTDPKQIANAVDRVLKQ